MRGFCCRSSPCGRLRFRPRGRSSRRESSARPTGIWRGSPTARGATNSVNGGLRARNVSRATSPWPCASRPDGVSMAARSPRSAGTATRSTWDWRPGSCGSTPPGSTIGIRAGTWSRRTGPPPAVRVTSRPSSQILWCSGPRRRSERRAGPSWGSMRGARGVMSPTTRMGPSSPTPTAPGATRSPGGRRPPGSTTPVRVSP